MQFRTMHRTWTPEEASSHTESRTRTHQRALVQQPQLVPEQALVPLGQQLAQAQQQELSQVSVPQVSVLLPALPVRQELLLRVQGRVLALALVLGQAWQRAVPRVLPLPAASLQSFPATGISPQTKTPP